MRTSDNHVREERKHGSSRRPVTFNQALTPAEAQRPSSQLQADRTGPRATEPGQLTPAGRQVPQGPHKGQPSRLWPLLPLKGQLLLCNKTSKNFSFLSCSSAKTNSLNPLGAAASQEPLRGPGLRVREWSRSQHCCLGSAGRQVHVVNRTKLGLQKCPAKEPSLKGRPAVPSESGPVQGQGEAKGLTGFRENKGWRPEPGSQGERCVNYMAGGITAL